ncbi:MAG: peptide deformylase [Flavobacteriaceae bacterium]|nr:peptide deformylase [Flavobacteriaceae bacterium]
MKVLDILTWPNEILKIPCVEVEEINEDRLELANDMLHTIESSSDGIGLSANQVGRSERLVVMKVRKPYIMFNPVIVKTSKGKMDSVEGCLSFPGKEVIVRRWKWVAVEFTDENGERVRKKFRELESRCVQHEIDHLNGILMIVEK